MLGLYVVGIKRELEKQEIDRVKKHKALCNKLKAIVDPKGATKRWWDNGY